MAVLAAVAITLVASFSACGGDDEPEQTRPVKPSGPTGPGSGAPQRPSAEEEGSEAAQPGAGDLRAGNRSVVSRSVQEAGAAIARYCFESLGHKTGLREDPPTPEEAAAKDAGVRTLVATVSRRPGLRLGRGENIQDRVTQAITVLNRTDCDKRAAKQLERALATYPEP